MTPEDAPSSGALGGGLPSRPRTRTGSGVIYERPLFGVLLNLPVLLPICCLAIGPILYSGWLSLHYYNLARPNRSAFVGLANYAEILASEGFTETLWITTKFVCIVVISVMLVGLAIALLLNQKFPGRGIVRAVILIPWAMPPVVNGLMWQWIYDAKVGALNGLLVALGFISEYQGWLSRPSSALLALSWADTWNTVPLTTILLLAALQRIPEDLYSAARIDGANSWQMFWHITFPWLAQALLIALILQTMAAIRAFDIIYVLTGGGPGGTTTTLSWRTYIVTFRGLDFGLGNAYAYFVSFLTVLLALTYFRLLFKRGEIET